MKQYLLLLFLFFGFHLFGQSLKGQVTEVNGTEIPFAKLRIVNTSYGTVANALGKYVLELKEGTYILQFDAAGFKTVLDTIVIAQTNTQFDVVMEPLVLELNEVTVGAQSKKSRGRELMKRVIDRRQYFYDLVPEYQCDTYCFGSLEKDKKDTVVVDSVIGKQKLNLVEWRAITSYKKSSRFKNEYYAYEDFTDASQQMGAQVSISFGNEGLADIEGEKFNPYLFVTGIKDAHINLFENLLDLPRISDRPLISPLAYNAFVYYTFYLEGSFLDENNALVYEVRVEPRFDYEALFSGKLFIKDSGLELVSYELNINSAVLSYFKDLYLVCDYEKIGERLVPVRREFVYNVKENNKTINGLIRLTHEDYRFDFDDSKRNFWNETSVYTDDAFDKDSTFWSEKRPFTLKDLEIKFVAEQDSIINYHESDEYKRIQDSTRNKFKWYSPITGFGHANSFKKQEWFVQGLLQQVVPFGIGGYRHRLNVRYEKEFENGKKFSVNPTADYGFRNQDLKGSLGGSFTFNPMRFSKVFFDVGDVYDFVNTYQNIQGSFSPANRVRNKKLEAGYRTELINGLYGRFTVEYSDRQSIENLASPTWDTIFGLFADPEPFDPYRIFMTSFDLEYHFRQKYIIRKGRKIVLGSPYPTLFFQYKKGVPNLLGAQANFDFMELKVSDEVQLNTFGEMEWKFVSGAFLRKKDLRLIEYKYFRTSDTWFFSNPLNSLQLLDTALSTANSYLQVNAIHHFKGFFLNKIWLINRLKLEETVGGSTLVIPDANFRQVEFYAGLERKIRLWKGTFKLGAYAVASDNNFDKANIRFKFGINFYNDFTQKWQY